eukprot:361944-Chlamydomonas_euryale.AAC.2
MGEHVGPHGCHMGEHVGPHGRHMGEHVGARVYHTLLWSLRCIHDSGTVCWCSRQNVPPPYHPPPAHTHQTPHTLARCSSWAAGSVGRSHAGRASRKGACRSRPLQRVRGRHHAPLSLAAAPAAARA